LRTGLTVLAIFLITALTAALVGPYLVDWSQQRSRVEAQLSRVLSERVDIRGPIDLKLLPSPNLVLNQVEIADPKTGAVLFTCEKMEMALGLTSLARGQFRFTQAILEHPTLILAEGVDGEPALPNLDLAKRSGSIVFDKIAVHGGRVRVNGPDGTENAAMDGIELDAEAASLLGPFEGSGLAATPGGATYGFHFATGVLEGRNLRLKATVDAGGWLPRSEFDGALVLADGPAKPTNAALGYTGAVNFSGAIPGVDGPTPWRASGLMTADWRGAALNNLDVRLGREDRALAMEGSAQTDFGLQRQAKITLSAKQLNVDAFLRKDGEDSATPAQAYSALKAALSTLDLGGRPPMNFSFDLSTPAAILGGDTIADVSFSASAGPATPVSAKLEASPPGGAHLSASGTMDLGPAPGFKGRIEARADEAQRLREWLALGAPELGAELGAIGDLLPYRSAAMVGDVDMSAAGFVARNLSLTLERSTFTGTLAVTRPMGIDRGRLFMDLRSEALDLDALPNVGASGDYFKDIDLSLALDAGTIRIARVGDAQVESGSLAIKLTKQGDDVRLERLSIADLGGASLEMSGAIDAKSQWLKGSVDASKLHDFALLVHRVAPGAVSSFFVDRAGALSPAKLTFDAQSSSHSHDVATLPDSLAVQGVAGTTHIDAKLDHAVGDSGALNATISLDAPDAAPLLRQFGLSTLSLAGAGRGHVGASFQGRWDQDLDGEITASLAGSDLAWRGRISRQALESDAALLQGLGTVKAANATPLLAELGIAAPDSGYVAPTELSAELSWRGGSLGVSSLKGNIGRAHFSGDLTYRPPRAPADLSVPVDPDIALAQAAVGENVTAAAPQIEGALSVDRLPLSALTGLALGAPQSTRAGLLWSDTKFSAGLANPPATEVALKIAALDVMDNILGREASVKLRLGKGVVALDDLSMNVAGGALSGHAVIRRDGANASLTGRLSIEPIALGRPAVAGRLSGSMDFASAGQSANALMEGLAGTGKIRLTDAHIPHLDQGALSRIVAKAQSPDYSIDQTNVTHALDLELNKQALNVGDADASASITAGILRAGPFTAKNSTNEAKLQANFDIRSFVLEIRAVFSELQAPKFWSGAPPSIEIVLKGPTEGVNRVIDANLFVAGLAAQAIARETERIANLESDIRERAFFNRRLKAGQFIHHRDLELQTYATELGRLKSEADRRRVEAEILKSDEEARKVQPVDSPVAPVPAPKDSQSLSTSGPPTNVPIPSPPPRPPTAPSRADPTATGLY
jgi:AsmA family/AsmA-like C-terminal region